jgi:hypothetical protein
MDFAKLSLSDKLILGGAALLTIAMFLPWFKFEFFGSSITANGFDVGFLWATLPWLLGLAMAGVIVMSNLKPDQELPELPVPYGQANLIAGGVAAGLIVLKLLIGESELDRSFGLFLAVIAGGGLAYGGFLKKGEDEGGTTSAAPPAPPTEF